MFRRESVSVQSLSLYSETSSGNHGRINFAPKSEATVTDLSIDSSILRFDAGKYIREIIEHLRSNPQTAVETGIVIRPSDSNIKHEVIEHYDQAHAITANKKRILDECPCARIVIGIADIDGK